MIAAAISLGVVVATVLWLAAFVRGPTPYDRLLMAHATMIAAALVAAGLGQPVLAVALALLDALLVLCGVKALHRRSHQPALAPLDETAP